MVWNFSLRLGNCYRTIFLDHLPDDPLGRSGRISNRLDNF